MFQTLPCAWSKGLTAHPYPLPCARHGDARHIYFLCRVTAEEAHGTSTFYAVCPPRRRTTHQPSLPCACRGGARHRTFARTPGLRPLPCASGKPHGISTIWSSRELPGSQVRATCPLCRAPPHGKVLCRVPLHGKLTIWHSFVLFF